LAECVADAGVKKLLLFNTHGGQVGLLDPVARELRARRGLLVVSTSWFQLPLLDAQGEDVHARFSAHERRFGAHAGEVETALMRALKPQRVRMDLAQDFRSSSEQRAERFAILGNGRCAKFAWAAQDLHPAGAAGDARAATAQNGRALLDAAGRALAQLLVEIDHRPPEPRRSRWPARPVGGPLRAGSAPLRAAFRAAVSRAVFCGWSRCGSVLSLSRWCRVGVISSSVIS